MKIKAFTSDLHFSHDNIISFCNRPFSHVNNMEEHLIRNYNEVVKEDDVCIFLGDVFFCNDKDAREIMDALNGHKLLVKGNHDKKTKKMLDIGFSLVVEQMSIMIDGVKCKLCHYPYIGEKYGNTDKVDDRYKERRPQKNDNQILIHGHTHSSEKTGNRSIHVGVDAWDYRPARYEEVEAIVKDMKTKYKL